MKKTVLILVAALGISNFASAQFFVGGSLGFGSVKNKYQLRTESGWSEKETASDNKSFHISPLVGYTLNEDWEIGLSLNCAISKNKTSDLDSNTYGTYLYGRRYFDLPGNFSWFVDAALNFSSNKQTRDYTSDGDSYTATDKSSSLGLYLEPGISYDFNEHWSADICFNMMSLGYSMSWGKNSDEQYPLYDRKTYNNEFGFDAASASNSFSLYLTYNF